MGSVRIQDLTKHYRERRKNHRNGSESGAVPRDELLPVLDAINLEIADGELVCILGPSGCGKTTLIRILAGFEEGSSGKVFIDGEEIKGPSPNHIFVFQHSGLLPWMSVWENASLGVRKMRDKEWMNDLVKHNLEIVGLTGFEHHYPHQLSGGMQRRAELARALVVNPDLFFLDEPFAGLDFLTRVSLREEMINMHTVIHKTIIFITHDIDEALIMADRLVILSDRPAKVNLDLPLTAPHPRDFSRDSQLASLRKEIYRTLGVHYAL